MNPVTRPFLVSPQPARFLALLATQTAFLLVIALAGCSQSTGIVGRWAGDQTEGNTTSKYEIEFRSDGTYSESIDVQTSDNSKPETSGTYRGNFTANAIEVTLEPKEILQNMEANSTSAPAETYSYKVNGGTLTIRTSSGPITLKRRWW